MATTPNPTDAFYWTSNSPTLGVRDQYNPSTQESRSVMGDGVANVIAVKQLRVPLDLDLGDIDPVSGGRIFALHPHTTGGTTRRAKVFFVLPETNVNYQSALDAVNKFQVEIPGGDGGTDRPDR